MFGEEIRDLRILSQRLEESHFAVPYETLRNYFLDTLVKKCFSGPLHYSGIRKAENLVKHFTRDQMKAMKILELCYQANPECLEINCFIDTGLDFNFTEIN